ncbi:MAG TPA: hypothetical protein VGB67_01550 [Fibrella sp.]|jgi:hypothetical protein
MPIYKNVTIYTSGEFMGNYTAIRCKFVTVEIRQWAQYQSAICVTFLEKGKRRPRSFVQSYKPSLVIAEGWSTPDAPSMLDKPVSVGNGVTIARTTHQSFSGGWEADFKAQVLPNVNVLADYHGHNAHDRYTPKND